MFAFVVGKVVSGRTVTARESLFFSESLRALGLWVGFAGVCRARSGPLSFKARFRILPSEGRSKLAWPVGSLRPGSCKGTVRRVKQVQGVRCAYF